MRTNCRDPLNRDPLIETPRRNMRPGTENPRKNIGPGSQTGSDIIQRPPMHEQTPVKILPCPKLRLQTVISRRKEDSRRELSTANQSDALITMMIDITNNKLVSFPHNP